MQFNSISQRIFFWLLIISLLPLIVISEIFFSEFKIQIQEIEFRHLSQMSDKKIEQINSYINERIADIEILSKNPLINNAIKEFDHVFHRDQLTSGKYLIADQEIRAYTTEYLRFGYYDLFLIATDGDVVYSVQHESDFATNLFNGPYKNTGLAEVTRDALAVLETGTSDFEFYLPSNEAAAFIATPIIRQGELLGVLVLQIDIDRVFEVVADNIGLGKTGEVVIARKNNGVISFIGEFKFDRKLDYSLNTPTESELALPMQNALNGESGYGISIDYRAEEVMAVWRYLPVFHWGIVIKKDLKEVFAIVQYMNKLRWLVLILLLLIIVVLAYIIGRSIVRPIRHLTKVSKEISVGNFHQLVNVESDDEVGQLAITFNQMSAKLKIMHIDLTRKADEAEKANLAKSDFLSRMSHELRTPMNAILGFGQMLELDAEGLNETQRGDVKEILDAGNHLLELINEVLDLARIESGKMNLSMEQIHVNDVLQQCLALIAVQVEAHHLKLVDRVSDRGYVVLADFTRLKQVLLNLLSNAVKYNQEYGEISIDADVIGNQRLRIRVTDEGDGLTEKEIAKLFTPFERLNAVDNVEGTGIGLVIAQNLIEMMGGSIGVDSLSGRGCTFWIELDLVDIDEKS